MTDGDKESISVSYRYIPKTNKVSIILLGPIKLLTALTAIYNIISLSIYSPFNLSWMILYAYYKGA